MGLNPTNITRDVLLEMKDTGLVAASGAWEVDSTAKIIDLKQGADVGSSGIGPVVAGEIVIDVSAIEIESNDEIYDLIIQGSTDSDFGTAANIVELAQLSLSAQEMKRSDSDQDDATGRYHLLFTNIRAGTVYQYVRGYTAVGGTVATGINFTAWLGSIRNA